MNLVETLSFLFQLSFSTLGKVSGCSMFDYAYNYIISCHVGEGR